MSKTYADKRSAPMNEVQIADQAIEHLHRSVRNADFIVGQIYRLPKPQAIRVLLYVADRLDHSEDEYIHFFAAIDRLE